MKFKYSESLNVMQALKSDLNILFPFKMNGVFVKKYSFDLPNKVMNSFSCEGNEINKQNPQG